jgi:hypothetical protein
MFFFFNFCLPGRFYSCRNLCEFRAARTPCLNSALSPEEFRVCFIKLNF